MEVIFGQDERGHWNPSPIAFQNVYEEGDRWEKVQGCEAHDGDCCGNCKMKVEHDCRLHGEDKPLHCCINPDPISQNGNCKQIWICTAGKYIGRQRRKCDPAGALS